MSRFLIPARETRVELVVVNSRFIATAAPAFSVEEARTFIDKIRTEFADASHNVPVFVIGHGSSVISHCTDDGEPSGTAGRPALAVLQGSGLGDIVVVVTRYFGGTKLGTGGLVRAYGDSVREVLRALPLAEKVATQILMAAIPYNLYERVRILVEESHGELVDVDFAADVTLTARFRLEHVMSFQAGLQELSAGRVAAVIIETDPETIVPVGMLGGEIL